MDLKIFATTFVALFLAEFGDKTQLAAISLTSETGKPLAVFLGSVAALALVTLLGVMFGSVLVSYVPELYLKKAAAVFFVVIGVLMWFRVF
jgi:putative Ca2+/H+ antiporter (TMEM165/GDT1 family)